MINIEDETTRKNIKHVIKFLLLKGIYHKFMGYYITNGTSKNFFAPLDRFFSSAFSWSETEEGSYVWMAIHGEWMEYLRKNVKIK